MLPPGAILELKIYQNAFAARVLPWTPLGELTVPCSWFSGGHFVAGKVREGRGGKAGKGGEGRVVSISPLLLLQFNYCY